MAMLVVSKYVVEDELLFEIIVDSFDDIREAGINNMGDIKLFVQNDEIPKDNTVLILPTVIDLCKGVRPFIIDWGIDGRY